MRYRDLVALEIIAEELNLQADDDAVRDVLTEVANRINAGERYDEAIHAMRMVARGTLIELLLNRVENRVLNA